MIMIILVAKRNKSNGNDDSNHIVNNDSNRSKTIMMTHIKPVPKTDNKSSDNDNSNRQP